MNSPTSTPVDLNWWRQAVIYEIYPQSFLDSNGDGIGDLAGVTAKLDYLQWLGIDAIWFNPCFASEFRDAGYDVSDYLTIAPRYGTNAEMGVLIQAAKSSGIRIILDLVAGHTSVEHAWFKESMNDPTDDRYIWADGPGEKFVASSGSRAQWYYKNFFPEQPALNFGYARLNPAEPWRQLPDAAGPSANRLALREIIGYWLDRGVAGFRVDMAFSLVKDDPDLVETAALWRDITSWMHETYPGSVILPEGDDAQTADVGERSGFDADFALVIHREHSALFNNGAAGILPWQAGPEPCYFDPDVSVADGTRALERFVGLWSERASRISVDRLIILPSSDHDFARLASGPRTGEQLHAAFTFLLTWGSIPSIYFGDEIGMRNLSGMPDKEGSICDPGYNRAGCRTPMQWDNALPNAGFSAANPGEIYLPQDPDPLRPTVAAQLADPSSLLNRVRALTHLRRSAPALGTSASRTVLSTGYPLVYLRGDSHLVVVNPRRASAHVIVSALSNRVARHVVGSGIDIEDGAISANGFGSAVFELHPLDGESG